jgi:hypothetical protein
MTYREHKSARNWVERPPGEAQCSIFQAAWEFFGCGPVGVCFWFRGTLSPSSSSNWTAAERFMPRAFAQALTDARSGAGSRTVTSGSPAARARLVGFPAFMT